MHRIIGFAALAALLVSATPATAAAQLGRLTKKVQRATTKQEPSNPPAAGAVRVTATIEWTVETTSLLESAGARGDISRWANLARNMGLPPSARSNVTPSHAVDNERGRITLQMDIDPSDLPGGSVSRMMGGRGSIAWSQGQPTPSSAHLVSFAGSVSLDRSIRPKGKCERADGMWIDPPTADLTGRRELRANDVSLTIGFMDDKPASLSAGPVVPGVLVSGKGSYACGGTFAARDSQNTAGGGLIVMEGTKWVTRVQPTTGGYALTGRADESDEDWRVIRTVTLTWTAPEAPRQQVAQQSSPAANPAFDKGKGSITFTQQGKQATWPLQSVASSAAQMGMSGTTFMFTPDGGQPSEEKGVLALGVYNAMGQTMVGLNVAKGPAGDTDFEAEDCTAQVKPTGDKAMSGSGECSKNGKRVTFTFTASKP
jgi:hypothetical protein